MFAHQLPFPLAFLAPFSLIQQSIQPAVQHRDWATDSARLRPQSPPLSHQTANEWSFCSDLVRIKPLQGSQGNTHQHTRVCWGSSTWSEKQTGAFEPSLPSPRPYTCRIKRCVAQSQTLMSSFCMQNLLSVLRFTE